MKYVDADKLKAEIERLYYGEAPKHDQQCEFEDGYFTGIATISNFIDSLLDENNPEPYNPVYDEDYLNEKIAKATKSWEGVDVDAMLVECRGNDEPVTDSHGLEEAARLYAIPHYMKDVDVNYLEEYPYDKIAEAAFIAGAEWQKSQMLNNAFMLNDVVHDGRIELEGDPLPSLDPILILPYPQFKPGDKVKVIVLKEKE